MRPKRNIVIFSRILASLIIIIGGSFWLTSWWYVRFRLGEEMAVLPVIILLILHSIGAISGFRASVDGILCMIIFTVLALIAPTYLNVPFGPTFSIYLLYFGIIFAEFLLIAFCLANRRRPISKNSGA